MMGRNTETNILQEDCTVICEHLKELFEVCEHNQIRLGSSDLIRIVCTQCQREETCPSALLTEIEQRQAAEPAASSGCEPK